MKFLVSLVGTAPVAQDLGLRPGDRVSLVVSGTVREVRPSRVVTGDMVTIVAVDSVPTASAARHAAPVVRRAPLGEQIGTHVLWSVGALLALIVVSLVGGNGLW